jgi:hypothetical protein
MDVAIVSACAELKKNSAILKLQFGCTNHKTPYLQHKTYKKTTAFCEKFLKIFIQILLKMC